MGGNYRGWADFPFRPLGQERARHGDQLATTEAVTEALGRLLIFRPSEPLELLRQLQRLRQILRQNPTAGLLVTRRKNQALKQGADSVPKFVWENPNGKPTKS